jgi:hypothetical protein
MAQTFDTSKQGETLNYEVLAASSYETLWSRMTELFAYNGETDAGFAKLLQNVLRGECINEALPLELLECLSDVAVLMFLCEGSRYTSSLVVNNMILDLIVAEKWTWEKAFSERKMPMAALKISDGVRYLERALEPYLPCMLELPGFKEFKTVASPVGCMKWKGPQKYLKLEAVVIADWIALKRDNNGNNEDPDLENLLDKAKAVWWPDCE